MSRIYFHSEKEETEVSGRERAYMGSIIYDIGLNPLIPLLKNSIQNHPIILNYIPNNCYVKNIYNTQPESFERVFRTWFRTAYGPDGILTINEHEYECFELALNTAIAAGSNPIKLFARIHGQCEIHAYIEGPNRKWIASIIKCGLESSIYHKDIGWESTIKMLESDDKSPVVMSYSICDSFPNQYIAHYDNEDKWNTLSSNEQWKLSMTELRKNKQWLELNSNTWDNYNFGNCMNSFAVSEYAHNR